MAKFELIIYSVPKEVVNEHGATTYTEYMDLAEQFGEVQTLHNLMKSGKLMDNAQHRALLVNRENPDETIVADFNETILDVRKVTCVGTHEEGTSTYCIYGKSNKDEVEI